MMRMLFILMLLHIGAASAGPVETYEFASPEQEQLYLKLSDTLRCLVCQNQSIAESNADLATDLRKEIYNMLQQGMDEDEIVAFMVERYGDFVLYKPPMKPMTWLLWFGPAIILIAGFVFVMRIVRKQDTDEEPALSEAEQQRLKELQSEARSTMHSSDREEQD